MKRKAKREKRTPVAEAAEREHKKRLIRRYLIWCYKTTREELDRIDRYFTQMKVDEVILDVLMADRADQDASYLQKVADFRQYMKEKTERAWGRKFSDAQGQNPQPDYRYLRNRLKGVEKAVTRFLGKKELKTIREMYEQEMTGRIMRAQGHS